jgi:4-hydroxy-tetrahydrodipicolinate reductase
MRIGVIGCGGRMGRANLRAILSTEGAELAGGVEAVGHPALGQDLGRLAGLEPVGMNATADLDALLARAHVVVEFTTPEASLEHARATAAAGVAHVIGTTGLDATQEAAIRALASRIPIVRAANTSLGVTLLVALTRKVAAALGPDWDAEIVEMHHRMKVDAPSGTALALGRAVAQGRGVALEAVMQSGRHGQTGARRRGDIGFATLRGGDVVGEHTVLFAAEGERVELSHKATDRAIFARGAVRAALWLAEQPPGLYGMEDVLGLS